MEDKTFKFKQFSSFFRIALQYFFASFFLKVPTAPYKAESEIIFVTIGNHLPEILFQLHTAAYFFDSYNKQQHCTDTAPCRDDCLQKRHCNTEEYDSHDPQQNQKQCPGIIHNSPLWDHPLDVRVTHYKRGFDKSFRSADFY